MQFSELLWGFVVNEQLRQKITSLPHMVLIEYRGLITSKVELIMPLRKNFPVAAENRESG
jgi:hypothetical protein